MEKEVYFVLRAIDPNLTGGVINVLSAINSINVYGLNKITLPKTDKFGFDHSLILFTFNAKNDIKSVQWFMIEVVKQLLRFDQTCAYLPKPYKILNYYGEGVGQSKILCGQAVLEYLENKDMIMYYFQQVQDRINLSETEKKNKVQALKNTAEYFENYD